MIRLLFDVYFNAKFLQELKRRLRSDIYMLQVECDRLADQVDQWSDRRGIYFLYSAVTYKIVVSS